MSKLIKVNGTITTAKNAQILYEATSATHDWWMVFDDGTYKKLDENPTWETEDITRSPVGYVNTKRVELGKLGNMS